MIALIAYHVVQMSATNFAGNSTILHELSLTPRNKTSTEVTNDITTMFYADTIPDWAKVLNTSDYPHDYFIIFSAFICNVIYISLGATYGKPVATYIMNKLAPVDTAQFII
jgi:hypothetical protein